MYSYVNPMSLVCIRMSSICHSYVIRVSLVCCFTMNPKQGRKRVLLQLMTIVSIAGKQKAAGNLIK